MRDPRVNPKVGDVVNVKRHTRMVRRIEIADGQTTIVYSKPSSETRWKEFECRLKAWQNWCLGGRVVEPVGLALGLASTPPASTTKV